MNESKSIVIKKKSRAGEIWRRFRKNKLAIIGMILFAIIMLITILADVIVDYNAAIQQVPSDRLLGPCAAHPFGTDNFGRDLFARIVHGSRNSLLVGFGSVLIGVTLGGILGAICGYVGGRVDSIVMRILDSIMCIPTTMMALAIVAALGTSLTNVLIAMTISSVPRYCRIIRSAVMSVTGQTYIEAAKSCGAPGISNYYETRNSECNRADYCSGHHVSRCCNYLSSWYQLRGNGNTGTGSGMGRNAE